ncbi:MAG: hypothetical protein V2A56_00755 [bacterium]
MRVGKLFFAVVAFLLIAPTAWALPGIQLGVHGNYQNTVISEQVQEFSFPNDPGTWSKTTLTRTEIGNPIGAGVDLTFTFIPVIDLQIAADMMIQTYDFVYTPPPPEISGQSPISQSSIPYGRLGVDVSIIKNLVSLPPAVHVLNLYVGIGPSVAFIAPIASQQLILDNIATASEEPDIEGYAKEQGMKIGFHAVVGMTLKVPIIPGIRVQAKYMSFGDVTEPDKSSFIVLQAGLFI